MGVVTATAIGKDSTYTYYKINSSNEIAFAHLRAVCSDDCGSLCGYCFIRLILNHLLQNGNSLQTPLTSCT